MRAVRTMTVAVVMTMAMVGGAGAPEAFHDARSSYARDWLEAAIANPFGMVRHMAGIMSQPEQAARWVKAMCASLTHIRCGEGESCNLPGSLPK